MLRLKRGHSGLYEIILTPGLQAKSTSVGGNSGPNGPKSNDQLKNGQNAMKTKINYRIV